MLVELGPVPAASARAWIDYARHALANERAHDPQTLPVEVRQRFEAFLAEWEAAGSGDELRWSSDIDPEVLEYLVHAFYRVATRLVEEVERDGAPAPPPEGAVFYEHLVDVLLGSLATTGAARAQFAEELRSFWPRVP